MSKFIPGPWPAGKPSDFPSGCIDFFYTDRYIISMDNRNRILQTALDLFAEHSYEGIGIQKIALAAGVTKPTLYHYFGSKQGLMEKLLAEWGEIYLSRTRHAAVYNGDVMGTLKSIAEAQLDFAAGHEAFYLLLQSMYTMPRGCPAYKMSMPYRNQEYEIIENIFSSIAADHGNIREKYHIYAATFMGMVVTYIHLYLRGSTLSRETLLHQVVHQYMHGIFS